MEDSNYWLNGLNGLKGTGPASFLEDFSSVAAEPKGLNGFGPEKLLAAGASALAAAWVKKRLGLSDLCGNTPPPDPPKLPEPKEPPSDDPKDPNDPKELEEDEPRDPNEPESDEPRDPKDSESDEPRDPKEPRDPNEEPNEDPNEEPFDELKPESESEPELNEPILNMLPGFPGLLGVESALSSEMEALNELSPNADFDDSVSELFNPNDLKEIEDAGEVLDCSVSFFLAAAPLKGLGAEETLGEGPSGAGAP